jgi:hypothetical protein
MKKWEYKTVCAKLKRYKKITEFWDEVNQLGKEGWRIVPIPLRGAGEFLMEREISDTEVSSEVKTLRELVRIFSPSGGKRKKSKLPVNP